MMSLPKASARSSSAFFVGIEQDQWVAGLRHRVELRWDAQPNRFDSVLHLVQYLTRWPPGE